MISDNNNITSNISYTNKDFQSIYVELLDLVKKLTNKWDPSISNESDPGVLLLKLNALIADKNNYNIDKNVLECFPLSVTQEGNARKLYDSLGYKMHWYRSATTSIGFQLISRSNFITNAFGTTTLNVEDNTIRKLTMVSDESGEYVYTILDDVYLSLADTKWQQPVYVNAIQGTVHDYTVNGSKDISINNLDSNLRLYFEETQIAENGIFIRNKGDENYDWVQVDNLTSYPLENKVFEFGVLPNSNKCYIQFPEDIVDLSSNNPVLEIKYVVSKGEAGNIKANTLNGLLNDYTWTLLDSNESVVINDSLKIIQSVGTLDGRNPETLDEAYNNYKRTIGTFNTLVTAKDYENYIYNAEYNHKNLLSNCVVADRTNDINVSTKVKVYNPNYDETQTIIKQNNAGEPQLDAFGIVLYALNQSNVYNETFEPNTDFTTAKILEGMIDEVKSINHDFINPNEYVTLESAVLYLVKNLISLKGQVLTYNKVTKAEAEEIELNIKNALKQNYNSRNLVFGESLDYNALVAVIQNADNRIKTVVLDLPSYQVNKVYTDSNNIVTNSSFFTDLNKLYMVARMVLAGNVQLFEFDDNFDYDFGKTNITTINNLKYISTNVDITPLNKKYKLKENEVLHFYTPNLITDIEYSTYVKYIFQYNNSIPEIKEGVDYKLREGESITLKYTDTNNKLQTTVLEPGTIVEFNFIPVLQPTSATLSDNDYKAIKSGQYLKTKSFNMSELYSGTQYYFVLNGDANLNLTKDVPYVLNENEYFIYTNANTTELIILGSGTMITANKDIKEPYNKIDLSLIEKGDKEAITWYTLKNTTLKITDLNIITAGEGCEVEFEDNVSTINSMNEIKLDGGFIITDGDGNKVTYNQVPDNKWTVRSRLLLNSPLGAPQLLGVNQSIILKKYVDENTLETFTINEEGSYVAFNSSVMLSGGTDLDVSVLDDEGNYNYTLQCYNYNQVDDKKYPRENGTIILSSSNTSNYVDEGNGKYSYTFTFDFDCPDDQTEWLIPVNLNINTANTRVKFYTILNKTGSRKQLSSFSDENVFTKDSLSSQILKINKSLKSQSTDTLNNLIVIFEPTAAGASIGSGDVVILGKISKKLGYNESEINVTNAINGKDNFDIKQSITEGTHTNWTIINAINEILNTSSPRVNFNWAYRVKDSEKVLQPTLSSSYFNNYHLYNNYCIPMITFDDVKDKTNTIIIPKSSIKVNAYSIY